MEVNEWDLQLILKILMIIVYVQVTRLQFGHLVTSLYLQLSQHPTVMWLPFIYFLFDKFGAHFAVAYNNKMEKMIKW